MSFKRLYDLTHLIQAFALTGHVTSFFYENESYVIEITTNIFVT